MSVIEKIMNSTSEGEILQLVEEHVIDIETPLSWREEAAVLERNGEKNKAGILRAAVKRYSELELG